MVQKGWPWLLCLPIAVAALIGCGDAPTFQLQEEAAPESDSGGEGEGATPPVTEGEGTEPAEGEGQPGEGEGQPPTEGEGQPPQEGEGAEETSDRLYTFRAISGISMGGGGAMMIGARHPELFDLVSSLGGITDTYYLLHLMMRQHLGGFCEREAIIADPTAFCGPVAGVEEFEHTQDFNHWYYSDNGGNFDRTSYGHLFWDLSYAFGNMVQYNAESTFLGAGIPLDWFENTTDAEKCAQPYVVPNLPHYLWNPDGAYNAITFCDGEDGDPRGVYDPTKEHYIPLNVAVAYDYNGSGLRDYGEPIAAFNQEVYQDIGCDGAAGGDDVYNYRANPGGQDSNWRHDDCEPYDDYGLDGVPGTGDYGEDNGVFDYSPSALNFLNHGPRYSIEEMSDETFNRLDWYMDAGIRDLFNFGVGANQVAGLIGMRGGQMAIVDGYESMLPDPEGTFDFRDIDYAAVGRNLYVRYGDPNASPEEIEEGDGGHVGTASQAVNRFQSFFGFLNARWPDGDYGLVDSGPLYGKLIDNTTYYSEALGVERAVSIVLPPGYYNEEYQNNRYPVIYMGHGYGMEPEDLNATALIFGTYMKNGDLQKMIIVYWDGQCCFGNINTGALDCVGKDANGDRPSEADGWYRECNRGSFYVNSHGTTGSNGRKYEDSFLDLMKFMDDNYRTRAPEMIKVAKRLGYFAGEEYY